MYMRIFQKYTYLYMQSNSFNKRTFETNARLKQEICTLKIVDLLISKNIFSRFLRDKKKQD